MKVILKDDIKGKGKKNETLDFPAGYANFLIRSNKAVMANDENKEKLKEELAEEDRQKLLKLIEAKNLYDRINGTVLMATSEKHPDGTPCGSITKKYILTQLRKLFPDVELNSKMLDLAKPINMFGDFNVGLTLHPEVKANIQISFMLDLGSI